MGGVRPEQGSGLLRSKEFEQFCGYIRDLSRSGSKQDVEAELERLLASEQFRATQRGRAFLKHIVEKALACEFESLKERILGVELFGRDCEFDTDRDSVVRVAANDVRRRLKDYYRAQPPSGVRIGLRAGSYIPEIEILPAASAAPAPAVAGAAPWSIRGWLLAALGLVLCAGLAITWKAMAKPDGAGVPSLWSMMLPRGKRSVVVMADANLVIRKLRSGADVTVGDYASTGFAYAPTTPDRFGGYLNNIPLTTVSDALLAARIAGLGSRIGCQLQVKSSRRFDYADLKRDEPIIFLGSATSNPWVGLLDNQLNFKMNHRFADGIEVCTNSSPRSGEPAEYAPSRPASGPFVGYALIAMVPNLGGRAPVLLISGTSTESTEAAGEFVTDFDRLRAALRKAGLTPEAPLKHLELVVKASYMWGVSANCEVVAHRAF